MEISTKYNSNINPHQNCQEINWNPIVVFVLNH